MAQHSGGSSARRQLLGEAREAQRHGVADPVQAELAARRHSEGHGRPYISPYNDLRVVAGQGTVGVELARDLSSVDVLFVSLGGGGLVSGAGGYLKAVENTRVVACSPANSPVMHESLKAGRILDLP